MAEVEQPIIKKIKKVEGGHHGGAWKVAYADFVTAMMAFFLLMWLISSTSKATKEGIAEYFTPTTGLKDSMGIGFAGGEKPTKDGKKKDDLTPMGIVAGAPTTGPVPKKPEQTVADEQSESKLFKTAEAEIKKTFEDDPNLSEFKDQIVVEQTPEGLKIEVLDKAKKQMFYPGNAEITEFGHRVLKGLLKIIEMMPNHISITGHTDATPLGRSTDYGNWELSADRANAARRFLLTTGMLPERVGKVVGRADQEPLDPNDPKSEKNRRITIIMLRGSHIQLPIGFDAAPRSLLTVPKVDDLGRPKDIAIPPRKANEAPAVIKTPTPTPAPEIPATGDNPPAPFAPPPVSKE